MTVRRTTKPALRTSTKEYREHIVRGQQRVNILWERTQAFIAVVVVIANMAVGVHIGFSGSKDTAAPPILSNGLFLVVGFYFSRTNHERVGGVGEKETSKYTGR